MTVIVCVKPGLGVVIKAKMLYSCGKSQAVFMDIEYPDPKSNTLLYFASVLPCLTKEVPF
jgi:hypothetical protein